MRKRFREFIAAEDGAITVDWVVLTALVLGVQIVLLLAPTRDALLGVSESIGDTVTEYGHFNN